MTETDNALVHVTGLSERESLFIEHYCTNGGIATRAYASAGYRDNNAHRVLHRPRVQAEIARRRREIAATQQIETWAIVDELRRIVTSDLESAFDDHGDLLPVREWPLDLRRAAAEVTIVREEYDNDTKTKTKVIKLKLWSKTEAADKLMRHLGAYAPERHQHQVVDWSDVVPDDNESACPTCGRSEPIDVTPGTGGE